MGIDEKLLKQISDNEAGLTYIDLSSQALEDADIPSLCAALQTNLTVIEVQFGFQKIHATARALVEELLVRNRAQIYINRSDIEKLIRLVAEGEQGQAEVMIKADPTLLLHRGDVTDLSGFKFTGITALQYAAWALDWHMWKMILKYLPAAVAQAQVAQFKTGSWVSEHGITAVELIQNLITALQQYVDNNSEWSRAQNAEHWIRKVGGAQRYLPAHVINEYCRPDSSFMPTPSFMDQTLPRTRQTEQGDWFGPANDGGRLGIEWGVIQVGKAQSFAWRPSTSWFATGDYLFQTSRRTTNLLAVSKLLSVRTNQHAQLVSTNNLNIIHSKKEFKLLIMSILLNEKLVSDHSFFESLSLLRKMQNDSHDVELKMEQMKNMSLQVETKVESEREKALKERQDLKRHIQETFRLHERLVELESLIGRICSERAQHDQRETELTAQLQQVVIELADSQAKQVAAQELIDSSQQALQEQIVLNESRNQEVVATKDHIHVLEQRLALSETELLQKSDELDEMERKIQTLQQNSQYSVHELEKLQSKARQVHSEKSGLVQKNQQLSQQCTSLKARLKILEQEHAKAEQQQRSVGHDLTQLRQGLASAQSTLAKREAEWKDKVSRAEAAGEILKNAKAEVEQKAELLEIHLNLFKKHGLPPKERAFQVFLGDVKRLVGLSHTPQVCYISYAWEDDKTDAGKSANLQLQAFLLRLERDMKTLGITVFLDVANLTGNISSCMSANIARSHFFILIGTERLQQRVQNPGTNVASEWISIEQRMQQNPNVVFPLLYQGDFTNNSPYTNAFPPGIEKNLIRDCRAPDSYYDFMAKIISPMSFIRALFGIHLSGRNETLQDGYEELWNKLELKFKNLELELDNETLRVSQSAPRYSVPTVSSLRHAVSSSSNAISSSSTQCVHNQWKAVGVASVDSKGSQADQKKMAGTMI